MKTRRNFIASATALAAAAIGAPLFALLPKPKPSRWANINLTPKAIGTYRKHGTSRSSNNFQSKPLPTGGYGKGSLK